MPRLIPVARPECHEEMGGREVREGEGRHSRLGEEFSTFVGSDEGGGRLLWDRSVGGCGEGLWGEGVATGLEHLLGERMGVGLRRNAEVTEHGVGFPTAKELDDVGVDVGAQEGCGPTGANAARREQVRSDARGGCEVGRRVAESVGDE